MSSGSFSTDGQPAAKQWADTGGRYGPAGYAAAVVTILLLGVATGYCALYLPLLVIVLPPLLITVALIAYGLTRVHGTTARIGRGMLVGCLAPLLSVLIFFLGWAAVGLATGTFAH